MIFFYAVLFLSFAVHKRMSTDTTIRFVLVILISVEACNAAVCPLSYYLQQPGHPLYREDINGRVKYSILTIYATQLLRLVFTLPWFFLKDKELINEVIYVPLCISSLITNTPFCQFSWSQRNIVYTHRATHSTNLHGIINRSFRERYSRGCPIIEIDHSRCGGTFYNVCCLGLHCQYSFSPQPLYQNPRKIIT